MEMNEWRMGVKDLATWFINYVERLNIAKKLECRGKPGHKDWTCCTVHRNFDNEIMRIVAIARRLQPSEERGQILSEYWWNNLGQTEVVELLRQSRMKK